MTVTTNTSDNEFLTRAYSLTTPEECVALYDDWAARYNKDVTDPTQNYVAPALAAQAVLAANGNINGSILDAGCGTGFVGIALSQAGAKTIDGVDLSSGMLKVARDTGVYKDLQTADLSKVIERKEGQYDVVTCVGTLTHGHVGPVPALKEFARVTKKGGLVVATILDDIWDELGYKNEVDRLKDDGLVDVVSAESLDYRKGADVRAKMLVMRKR